MRDARHIVKALGGMWAGSYGLVRCPAHDDRNPSLKIKDDPGKRDGIDLICFAGCDWKTVKSELVRRGLLDGRNDNTKPLAPRSKPKPEPDQAGRIEYALKLWGESVRLRDTLAWRYFCERRQLHIGVLGSLHHALRWHEQERAVIALMTDPLTNKPTGVHRTFLNS
jgi:hypothetical protein